MGLNLIRAQTSNPKVLLGDHLRALNAVERTPSAAALDRERGPNGARLGQDFTRGQVRFVLSEPLRSLPRAEKWDAGMMETGNPLAGLSGAKRARTILEQWGIGGKGVVKDGPLYVQVAFLKNWCR